MAILISALGPGGAERVIAQLSKHWAQLDHTVTLISFDRPEDPVYHQVSEAVQLIRLNCPTAGWRGNFRKIARLRKALGQAQPDVLVSFLTKNNLLASLSTIGLPIKLIACERNNPERQIAHPAWNMALNIAYHRADAIVCQTRGVRRCFPAGVHDRISVIPNPIAPMSRDIPKPARKVTAVGRLDQQKGFDLLIDAFAQAAAKHPDWSLDIWGSGPEKGALQDQIDHLSMGDRIKLRGNSAKPGGWLREADLFVLSSRYEGFPNVLGEALSAGLPTIATDCDFGPADLVTHGQDGWLVPPEDTEALSMALDRLLSDEPLRRALAQSAPISAARFASEDVMAQWDSLIDRVLASQTEGPPVVRSNTGTQPAE